MQSSLLYGLTVIALIAIILFFYRWMAVKHPVTTVIPLVPIVSVWPWDLTVYSYWPYWLGGGGYSGGYSGASGSTHGSGHGSGLRPWGGTGRSANGLHSVSHGSGGHGSGGHSAGGHSSGGHSAGGHSAGSSHR